MSVFSTSGTADGSQTAVEIRRFVSKCAHRLSDDPSDAAVVADAGMLCIKTERVLDAIEHLMEATALSAESEDRLSDAETDDALTEVLETHDRAVAAEQAALVIYARDHTVDRWPPEYGSSELLAACEENLTLIGQVISDYENLGVAGDLAAAHRLLVKRHRALCGLLA